MVSSNGNRGLLNSSSNYVKFDQNKEDLSELISREENKFFAMLPLCTLTFLQIIFGVLILIAQILMNQIVFHDMDCEILAKKLADISGLDLGKSCIFNYSSIYGILCGGFIAFTGILSFLITVCKSNSLLVVSGFLNVVLYGVSIFLSYSSYNIANHFQYPGFGPDLFEIYRIGYTAMAIVAGVNLVISIFTSAFFCRAGCSCCQPHAPTIMYLTQSAGIDGPTQPGVGGSAA